MIEQQRIQAILRTGALALVTCSILVGCSAKHYRESADKEVYRILSSRQKSVLGVETPFTIEQTPSDPLEGLPRKFQPLIPQAAGASDTSAGGEDVETPPATISLTKAIEIAIQNSREYQRRKEDVYLSALDLTLERYRWSPRFSALLSGRWQRAEKDESWAGETEFGVTQLLASGASISLELSSEFLRHVTGDPRATAASVLSATIIQPLWRGAGRRIAQEDLTQAERDVIYAIRSFARFHKVFTVSIATSYYSVLRQRDVVRNEWNNYQKLIQARERSEMLAEAGRFPEFQADQAKQDELRARDRWIRSQQRYKQLLDRIKIDMGLTTDADVDMDDHDLQTLSEMGIVHPEIAAEDAVRQALALRLDLMNAEDQVADAERKVEVAANGLGGDVDLVLSSGVGTEEDTKAAKFRFDRGSYSAGANVSLPVDRKAERNIYRRALITLERARRDATLLSDQVRLQVRQALRDLEEMRESYKIQRNSLELAERRVESTTLLLDAGRADTRDLLESQAALVQAQNAFTNALVDHTIARLNLWRDIGTLVLSPEGELEEKTYDEKDAGA